MSLAFTPSRCFQAPAGGDRSPSLLLHSTTSYFPFFLANYLTSYLFSLNIRQHSGKLLFPVTGLPTCGPVFFLLLSSFVFLSPPFCICYLSFSVFLHTDNTTSLASRSWFVAGRFYWLIFHNPMNNLAALIQQVSSTWEKLRFNVLLGLKRRFKGQGFYSVRATFN